MVIGTREAILKRIGQSIHERRLRKNITQRTLAERSGISMTAVKHLERGVGATLGSFVQVCRTLDMDGWIEEIEPRDELSPIAYADALKKAAERKRRRAHV